MADKDDVIQDLDVESEFGLSEKSLLAAFEAAAESSEGSDEDSVVREPSTEDPEIEYEVAEDEGGEETEEEGKSEDTASKSEQADPLLDLLPDKFKEGVDNSKSAIERMARSYEELERKYSGTNQELQEALRVLRGMSQQAPPAEAPATPAQPSGQRGQEEEAIHQQMEEIMPEMTIDDVNLDGIDTSEFIDNPSKVIGEVVKRYLSAARIKGIQIPKFEGQQTQPNEEDIVRRVTDNLAVTQSLQSLQNQDPDKWPEYAQYLRVVLEKNPHLDTPNGLPIAYEKAKQMHADRVNALRKEIGVDEDSVKAYKDEIVQELLNKIGDTDQLRKAASGLRSDSSGGEEQVKKATPKKAKASDLLREWVARVDPKHSLLSDDF